MNSDDLLPRVWREHVARHWRVLSVALALMTIEGGMLGVLSYMVRPMFDRVFVAGESAAIAGIALTVFVLFVARAAAGFGQRYLVVRTGLRVTTGIQKDLAGHLMSLDTQFFQTHPPGGLIERVRGDAQALQQTASTALMNLGRDSVGLISLLAVVLWVDWVWALLVFAGIPVVVLPILLLHRRIRATTAAARRASADISTRLDEIFHGMLAIKLNRLEAHERDRFETTVDRFLQFEQRSQAGRAGLPAMVDLLAAIGFLGVLIVGGHEIATGEKTVGEFMSFFTAMILLFGPLRRLSNTSGHVQAAMASLERLYSLFDSTPAIVSPDVPAAPVPAGDIVFDDVHFAYDGTPVLCGLGFTAPKGRVTALVGASGAGKSTVFNLLTRLIEPQSGRIAIGGADIATLNLQSLREHFAMVSQDAALFDESIRENIRLGRLDATDAEVEAAAEDAKVTEFTRNLPSGLDSPAGPRGANLSGGQRQRVAIARAILRDAPVLLLDEPTSALDARSEALIQEALERLSGGRTTLVIAHRFATIRDADLILVLDKGRLVDQGRHEDLLARGGLYAQLYQMQFAKG